MALRLTPMAMAGDNLMAILFIVLIVVGVVGFIFLVLGLLIAIETWRHID